MFKLIKYELQGNYKFVLGNILMVIILNLLLITRKGIWDTKLIIGLCCIIFVASVVVIFIEAEKLMSRYMKGDEGYLLLTIPQRGSSILTSRLITALIEILIVSSISFIFLWINLSSLNNIAEIINAKIIFNITIGSMANIILILTLIYFSIVISKVAFKNKKIGGVGALLIFLTTLFLINYVAHILNKVFQSKIHYGDLYAKMDITATVLGGQLRTVVKSYKFSIPSLIYNIIIFIGLFTGTSYMLEKKVDL